MMEIFDEIFPEYTHPFFADYTEFLKVPAFAKRMAEKLPDFDQAPFLALIGQREQCLRDMGRHRDDAGGGCGRGLAIAILRPAMQSSALLTLS